MLQWLLWASSYCKHTWVKGKCICMWCSSWSWVEYCWHFDSKYQATSQQKWTTKMTHVGVEALKDLSKNTQWHLAFWLVAFLRFYRLKSLVRLAWVTFPLWSDICLLHDRCYCTYFRLVPLSPVTSWILFVQCRSWTPFMEKAESALDLSSVCIYFLHILWESTGTYHCLVCSPGE